MKPIWYKCWLDEFLGVPILSEFAVSNTPVAIATLKVVEVSAAEAFKEFTVVTTTAMERHDGCFDISSQEGCEIENGIANQVHRRNGIDAHLGCCMLGKVAP